MRKRKDLKFAEKIARKADELGERANVHYAEGDMRIGGVMYIWRMAHKKTVADIAKELGVTVSTVRRLEAGRQFPDGHNVIKIMNWLFAEESDGESESTSRIKGDDSEDGQRASMEALSGRGY